MPFSSQKSRPHMPQSVKGKTLRCGVLTLTILLVMTLLQGCFLTDRSAPGKLSHEINEQEDVVNFLGTGLINLNKLDEFLERKTGSQRIIQYTIEGDPIFTELRYEGDQLKITYDNTEDAFGSKEIRTNNCSALSRQAGSTELKYTLTGCDGEYPEAELLRVSYGLSEQADFGFVLKYGVNRRNEINTLEQRLVKDLQNGRAVEAADFRLPHAQLQSIYRELVLAGYMQDKTLTEACNIKPAVTYELQVKMNDNVRNFVWSECDQSADGKVMTALAQSIISGVQESEFYQALPETKGYYE